MNVASSGGIPAPSPVCFCAYKLKYAIPGGGQSRIHSGSGDSIEMVVKFGRGPSDTPVSHVRTPEKGAGGEVVLAGRLGAKSAHSTLGFTAAKSEEVGLGYTLIMPMLTVKVTASVGSSQAKPTTSPAAESTSLCPSSGSLKSMRSSVHPDGKLSDDAIGVI